MRNWRRGMDSAGGDGFVTRDVTAEPAAEEADVEADHGAPGALVVEDGVGDELIESCFVGADEGFACGGVEHAGVGGTREVGGADHAGIDGGDEGGIDDDGAEGLHEVECECGTAVTGLVEQAPPGVEAISKEGDGELLGQEGVAEGEEGIDGVSGRAAVAGCEVPGGVEVARFEHVGEALEVDGGDGAFEAEELIERVGGGDAGEQVIDVAEDSGVGSVSSEERALVGALGGDEGSGEGKAAVGAGRGVELCGAVEGISQVDAGGDAVEPMTHGEVDDGDGGLAEEVEGLSGELDVAAEDEMTDIFESGAAQFLAGFADDEGLAGFADEGALFLDIEGEGVVAGGIEASDAWGGLVGRNMLQGEGFVGQTDRVEGATGAFGAVVEGWGKVTGGGGSTSLVNECEGSSFELGREGDVDACAGAGEIEDAMVAAVAVLAEEQALSHELDTLIFVGAELVIRCATAFRLDGDGFGEAIGAGGGGDEVERSGQAESRAVEWDAAGDDGGLVAVVARGRV